MDIGRSKAATLNTCDASDREKSEKWIRMLPSSDSRYRRPARSSGDGCHCVARAKRERDSDWFRTPEEMCDRTRSGSSPDMFERKRPARGSSISTRGDFSELYYFRRPDARLSSSKTGVEMREILNHADAHSI
ncbi:hypothetical protein [Burkholderia ubonensis]|uniref:hypothetical protein n=1 Tax=Burkholderia ubonensis TaxID=101571 RepID=UPI0012F91821|nr:hypothetical protein [Burkholderia ubonensis]